MATNSSNVEAVIRGLKLALTWVAAFWALIAAVLWYKASTVRVKPDPDYTAISITEGDEESDFASTVQEQTRWNKRAAFAACTSAVCQGVALFLPE